MRCRDSIGLAERQFVKLGRRASRRHALDLVDDEEHRPARSPQEPCNAAVLGGEARTSVDDEEHRIGFGDRRAGLLRHFVQDPGLRHRLESARVDDDEPTLARAPATVVAIARESGKIGDERRAALRQSVEQRRLADIRAADDDEDGEH